MATCETPEEWRQQLSQVQDQVVFHQKVVQDLEQLSGQWAAIQQAGLGAESGGWEQLKVDLLDQLDALKPTDEAGKDLLKSAIIKAKQEIAEVKVDPAKVGISTMQGSTRGGNRNLQALAEPPSLSGTAPGKIIKSASQKLKVFRWTGRSIALLMLSGAGFQQLYLSNATFGSAGLGDYLTLIAWGFGAEVTRDSVTKSLKKLRLPGLKEE
jgi:hypothetical protein